MPYDDFSLESVTSTLGVTAEPADLFGDLAPVPVPPWLREQLDRGMRQVLLSEKARSEFIVVRASPPQSTGLPAAPAGPRSAG